MGIGRKFGSAFAKAWLGAGHDLPTSGKAFLSVHDRDKPALLPVARRLISLDFELIATAGTAHFLSRQGLKIQTVRKIHEGQPNIVDALEDGSIDLVVNTPLGQESHIDDAAIRQTALKQDIPIITTLSGAMAAVEAIASLRRDALQVRPLQELGQQDLPPV